MIWIFALGLLTFLTGAVMSYIPSFNHSAWATPGWIALAIVGALSWAAVCRATPDATRLLVLGMYWDTLMQLSYVLVPVLVFGARLTMFQSAGLAMIFAGLLMVKG